MSESIQPIGAVKPVENINKSAPMEPSQTSHLKSTLTFSKHLDDRLQRRQLQLPTEKLSRLENAVSRAAGKGATDSVVFLDELALIVNVPSRTVITAMETDKMKEGVFTNIDSVVLG